MNESLPEGIETVQDYAKQIKQACSECYGTAFHAWIEHLVAQPLAFEEIQTELTAIVAKLVPEKSSAQVKRVAESFALLAYAGEEATKLRITGWPEGTAFSSIERCFRGWLADFGNSESLEEEQIVSHVLNLLISHKARFSPLESVGQITPQNRLGWFDGEQNMFYVIGEIYNDEFCNGRRNREVSKVLFKRGILVPGKERPFLASSVEYIPEFKKGIRCYKLQLPKELENC